MNEKIILTDFCHTIVDYPTCDNFVKYVKNSRRKNVWMYICESVRVILHKTQLIRLLQHFSASVIINKVLYLNQLKGINEEEIRNLGHKFYNEYLQPHLISEVLDDLRDLVERGFDIYVVSSAYDVYLKDLINDIPVKEFFCTELLFKKGKFTGKYKGKDVFGIEKYNKVCSYFSCKSLKGYESIGFSDEYADCYMLDMCSEVYIVKKKNAPVQEWVKEKKYGIIEFV